MNSISQHSSSIPLQKLLRLLGVDSLPIEANSEGHTCWYQGSTWQVALEESQDFRNERATLKLTAEEINLAQLATVLDLNERYAEAFGWLTLQDVRIYGTAGQYSDREYLSIEATVVADSKLNLPDTELSTGALKNLRFQARIRHRTGTYKKAYTVALLADFAIANTTLQVGIALPVGQSGAWTLELHQGGEGLSWESLKQLFVPTGETADTLNSLHDQVSTFTFHLNTLLIRFDPTAAHPIGRIELDVSAEGTWNLLGNQAPHLALREIGLRLQVDFLGQGDFAYSGAIRGTLEIGEVKLSAELPLPWTGSFTLRAEQATEDTFHLDAFAALAEGEPSLSSHLPDGLHQFALRLRMLEVVVEHYQIESFSLDLSSAEEAGSWEMWKDHLTLDDFDFSLALRKTSETWQSSGSLKATATLQGVQVAARLEKDPEGVWDLSITDPVHFGTLARVKDLVGLDLSDDTATDQLPALQSPEGATEPFGVVLRQFRLRTDPGSFELHTFSIYLETEGQLSLSNKVVLDRAVVVVRAEKTDSSLHVNRAQIGGTLHVAGHPIRLVSEKNSTGSDWTFRGSSQPGDRFPVVGLMEQVQLEQNTVPADLSIQDISLNYTPHTAALQFSAVANLVFSDRLNGRFQVDLDRPGSEASTLSLTAIARIRIAEAIFRITGAYDKAWAFSGAMEGTLTLSDLLEAFFEVPGDSSQLPINPSVTDINFQVNPSQKTYAFSGTAGVSVALPKGNPLTGTITARLDRTGEKEPWTWDLSGALELPLGNTTLSLTAHAASSQTGWQLAGKANVSDDKSLFLGDLISDITQYVGEPQDPPKILEGVQIQAYRQTWIRGHRRTALPEVWSLSC